MAPRPIEDHSNEQLKNVIANYRRHSKTSDPYYLNALDELDRRKGHGLSFHKSLDLIRKAGAERRFLSYKELADESGAEWSKVHYAMNGHLGELIHYAHGNGWPLLSAIVVNQQNIEAGNMEPSTLKGFAEAARALGYAVTDETAFLREQQERVFEWAVHA